MGAVRVYGVFNIEVVDRERLGEIDLANRLMRGWHWRKRGRQRTQFAASDSLIE